MLRMRLAAGSALEGGEDCRAAEKAPGETMRSRGAPSGVEAGGAATTVDMAPARRGRRGPGGRARARSLVGAS